MSTTVDTIKDRLSVTDVIGAYVKLEKAGANLKGRCPFHQEKTPSFMVSPARNSYYCFGCGAKGDIFSFVEDDLDKILCLFVPLLRRWYEDDCVAFKVSTCSVYLTLSQDCVFVKFYA